MEKNVRTWKIRYDLQPGASALPLYLFFMKGDWNFSDLAGVGSSWMKQESQVQTKLFIEETLLGTGDRVIQRLLKEIYIIVRKSLNQ